MPNIDGPVNVHVVCAVLKQCRSGRGRLRDHHRRSVEFGLCLEEGHVEHRLNTGQVFAPIRLGGNAAGDIGSIETHGIEAAPPGEEDGPLIVKMLGNDDEARLTLPARCNAAAASMR